MPLASLHLRNFRNFAEQRLEFPPAGAALVGDNGQGKTNLLEAVYYLEILRSFRGAPDDQLVRFGAEVFRVEGTLEESGAGATLAAAFGRRGRRKKVTVNGTEPPRLGDALGRVGATVFSPADVALVAGAPGERRRFLDIMLSLSEPGYLGALQRFRQTLARRNALLRGGADAALVNAWNAGLVEWGSRVIAARASWVRRSGPSFTAHYAHVSGGAPAAVEYVASVQVPDEAGEPPPSGVATAFHAALERGAEREAQRGMTLVGPHRDDLRFPMTAGSDTVDLRVYGSGGQQRTAAIALRMTEAETVRETVGRPGILLLDDVFAELDAGRSERILQWIEREQGQVILAAPKPGDWEPGGGSLAHWTIRDGVVSPL